MNLFKKISSFLTCITIFSFSSNTLALHSISVFHAPQPKDVAGYYILSSTPPNPPKEEQPIWADSTSGTCPGITFPTSIASGLIPNSQNEIMIDPKSIEFPYDCSTIYTLTSTSSKMLHAQKISCLVSVELTVNDGQIEKVNLTAIGLSGSNCAAYPNSPYVILGWNN